MHGGEARWARAAHMYCNRGWNACNLALSLQYTAVAALRPSTSAAVALPHGYDIWVRVCMGVESIERARDTRHVSHAAHSNAHAAGLTHRTPWEDPRCRHPHTPREAPSVGERPARLRVCGRRRQEAVERQSALCACGRHTQVAPRIPPPGRAYLGPGLCSVTESTGLPAPTLRGAARSRARLSTARVPPRRV